MLHAIFIFLGFSIHMSLFLVPFLSLFSFLKQLKHFVLSLSPRNQTAVNMADDKARPGLTSMEGMIWNANHVLEQALSPGLKGIPKVSMILIGTATLSETKS
jgi:hypothetical protein